MFSRADREQRSILWTVNFQVQSAPSSLAQWGLLLSQMDSDSRLRAIDSFIAGADGICSIGAYQRCFAMPTHEGDVEVDFALGQLSIAEASQPN